jgi:hypothetical protein
MSIIMPEVIKEYATGSIQGRLVEWSGITENDTCAAYEVIGFADKSIDINGSFGGGSFAIHGANRHENPVFSVISDADGNDITGVGVNRIRVLQQHTYWVKPVRTGGTSMDVDITLLIYNSVR